jgi:hypothetical protein
MAILSLIIGAGPPADKSSHLKEAPLASHGAELPLLSTGANRPDLDVNTVHEAGFSGTEG